MLRSKLPRSVLVELERMKNENESWTVEKFRKLLKRHINIQEAGDIQVKLFLKSEDQLRSPHTNKINVNESSYSQRSFGTGETLLSNESSTKSKYGKRCIFCGDGHWSDECLKYPDIQSRKKKLHDRCFRCMKNDHKMKDCKVTSKGCVHCGERDKHHRTLCPKKFQQKFEQKQEKTTGSHNT